MRARGPSAPAAACTLSFVAIREEHLVDAGGIDELPGRSGPDRADPDDERVIAHRNSGPSSSRQPPCVGGTPPRPRKREIAPINPAIPMTKSTRLNAFTARECIEGRSNPVRSRGATWNRTRDLVLIRDAL